MMANSINCQRLPFPFHIHLIPTPIILYYNSMQDDEIVKTIHPIQQTTPTLTAIQHTIRQLQSTTPSTPPPPPQPSHNQQTALNPSIIANLLSHEIEIVPIKPPSQQAFNIQITKFSHNMRLIQVRVYYRQYKFHNIQIVINDSVSPLHQIHHQCTGHFGKVFMIKMQGNKVGMKCLKCLKLGDEEQPFQKHFENVLKEYLFLKMASALKAGPAVQNTMGFNIFVYHDCIQFGMEQCALVDLYSSAMEQELSASLTILHSLKLVHFDIKPQNLAFSHAFQRHVFIDFGLSEIVQSSLGQKQFINFRGTYSYCSKDMQKLHNSKLSDFVDVYQNDRYALRQTLEVLRKRELPYRAGQEEMLYELSPVFELDLINYHLFNSHKEQIIHAFFKEIYRNTDKIKIYGLQIKQTIFLLPYSRTIQRLFSLEQRLLPSNVYFAIKMIDFYRIKHTKPKSLHQQSIQNGTEIQNKFNLIFQSSLSLKRNELAVLKQLSEASALFLHSEEEYFRSVAKNIRLQNIAIKHDEKLTISKTFCQVMQMDAGKDESLSKAFGKLYSFCTHGQINSIKLSILSSLIASFFILQLAEEVILMNWLEQILSKKGLGQDDGYWLLIVRFLTSIQWIKCKIISIYSYQGLKQKMWNIFFKHLGSMLNQKHPFYFLLYPLKITYDYYYSNDPEQVRKGHKKRLDRSLRLEQGKLKRAVQSTCCQWNLLTEIQRYIYYGLQSNSEVLRIYLAKSVQKLKKEGQQFINEILEFVFYEIMINKEPQSNSAFRKLQQIYFETYFANTLKYYQIAQAYRFQSSIYHYVFPVLQQNFTPFHVYQHFLIYYYINLYDPFYYQFRIKSYSNNTQHWDAYFQLLQQHSISTQSIFDLIKCYFYLITPNSQFRQKRFSLIVHSKLTQLLQAFRSNLSRYTHKNPFNVQLNEIQVNFDLLFKCLKILQRHNFKKPAYLQSLLQFTYQQPICIESLFFLQIKKYEIIIEILLEKRENALAFEYALGISLFLIKAQLYNQTIPIIKLMVQKGSQAKYIEPSLELFRLCIRLDDSNMVIRLFRDNWKSHVLNLCVCLQLRNKQFTAIHRILDKIMRYSFQINSREISHLLIHVLANIHKSLKLYAIQHKIQNILAKFIVASIRQREQNPFYSFWYVVMLSQYLLNKTTQREIYLHVCQSIVKLSFEVRQILISYLFNQLKFTHNIRFNRKRAFSLLKRPFFFVKEKNHSKMKQYLKCIIKVKSKYNAFYKIFINKLRRYFGKIQSSQIIIKTLQKLNILG